MNPRPVSPINNLKHWRTPAASRSSNGRCRWTFALAAVAWCGLVWLANPPTLAKPPDSALKSNPTKTKEGTVKPEGPAPVIKVDNPTKDLGATWVGPMLEHAFTITNEGDAPLEITKVRPACGCMIAGPYPKTIEPGKSGEFPFKVNSTKLRGKYEKSITISSNDPVTPALKLKLRGEVKRYVEVLPTSANFGKVTTNEPRERVLKITNNTDKPLELNLTKTEDQIFRFDLVEKKPGQEYELRVKMDPPYVPGAPRGMTTLVTNLKQQKDINIRVSARIPGRLEVQPPAILFDSEKHKDRGYSRPIRFTNYGSNPVHLLGVASDDPQSIQVAMKERTAGRAYTVNVEIPAGYTPPDTGRTITLKTDDPDKPTITIPVKRRASRSAEKTPRKRPAEEMVGKPAQSFTAVTTQGATFSSASLQGKVTVMDFFAPNCGYCKKQIPRMEKIRQAYTDKDVRFVVVSQTMRKKYTDQQVKGTINELGFNGELVIDHDNNIGPLFKSTSFPTMVIVGKTGKIEAVNVGNVGDLEDRMKGQLDALLAGQPVPKVAKKTPPKKEDTKPDKPRKRPIEELVGQPAPSFELTTTGGRKLSSKTMAGKVTVLDFFAVNCGYCGKQIPRVEKIRQTYADKGVQFVAVSQTMRKKFTDDEVKAKINDLGFKGDLAIDSDNTVGPLFKATGFPSMVIVGKTGKVEAVNIGNVGDLEDRMKGQLDALLAGQPVPKVAKKTPPKKDTKPKQAEEGVFGKPAPKFELTSTAGKKVSNDTLANTVTVLDFFAPNCGYCGKQLPRVEGIRKTYADKGVRFIAVGETMRKKFTDDEYKAKLAEFGFAGELAIDPDNKVGRMFQIRGYPSMVVLGKTGKVESVNVGNIADLEEKLTGQLDALLAGTPIPEKYVGKPRPRTKKQRPAEELVGKPAPGFELTTTAGQKLSKETLAGKVAVLDFFAPNCGYCGKQIPRVEEIRKTYKEKGVEFVAVGETMRKKFGDDEYQAKLDQFGFKGALAIDPDNKVGQLFKATGFPTMVILGKTGKVEAVNVGNLGDLEDRMKGQLDALLAGKPIPPKYASKPKPSSRKRPAEELKGKPSPTFETVKTLAGKDVSNAGFAGHPATVLNFVAPNCGYCKRQVPKVESIREEYEKKGVRFVNVVQTMRKEYSTDEALEVFKGVGSNLEFAHDSKNVVGKAYQATSFPTMVVVGKDGKVEHVNIGAKPDIDTMLKTQLDGIIAGKPAAQPEGAPKFKIKKVE